jgi:hypothetical protein
MTYPEIDAQNIPDSWKALPHKWGHSLHTICSRTGSFPTRLAHYFIQKYSKKGQTILDIYSGKGTAPLEACLLGRKGIGNDISPDAFVLTYAKTNPPSKSYLFQYLKEMETRSTKANILRVPENVQLYFERKTLKQILSVGRMTESDLNDNPEHTAKYDSAMFVRALMLGMLHGSTSYALSLPLPHSFAMSPSYVKKRVTNEPLRFRARRKNVIECLRVKAGYVFKDPIPEIFVKGEAFMMDAALFHFDGKANLALFSPPYFATHTYAWDNWLRLWFLGHDYKEIGRKLLHTNNEDIYLEHLRKALNKTYSLLENNSRCFIVVGDVRGHKPTAYLVASMIKESEDIGFEVNRIINDTIDRKRKYPYGDNSHIGIQKDRILELHKGNPPQPKEFEWMPASKYQ